MNIPYRIASRIARDVSGCWLWQGGKTTSGYAGSRGPHGVVYVHRLMYELAYGAIPAGHQIHHACEVRHCVNPEHLAAVTQREHNDRHGHKHARLGVLARMQKHPDWNWRSANHA